MALRLSERQLAALRDGKKVPRARRGEQWCDLLAHHLDIEGINYRREFFFARPRRFRFDFAMSGLIAVEVDGVVHRIANRFDSDREKLNLALLLGWRVLRVSPAQVRSGEALDLIRKLRSSG